MHFLNQRVGFFRKKVQNSPNVPASQNQQGMNSMNNVEVKIYYFFISSKNARMYYDENWYRIRSLIAESKSIHDIEMRIEKEGLKSLDLKKYAIASQIIPHTIEDDKFPFINRLCFEMVSISGQMSSLYIFGIADEPDLQNIYNFVHNIDANKKNQFENPLPQLQSHSSSFPDQQAVQENNQRFFKRILQQYEEDKSKSTSIESFSYIFQTSKQEHSANKEEINGKSEEIISQIAQISDELTYSGLMKNNKPHGIGMELNSTDGIQYKGDYREGHRHGPGQFVDGNLEMYQFEYIMGRPAGI